MDHSSQSKLGAEGNRSYQIKQFGAPLELACEAIPDPKGSEVLLRVELCGICHSDLHVWHGPRPGTAPRPLPLVMGHEIVGEIVAAGAQAGDAPVGARRIVFPWIGCGDCRACLAGREVNCGRPRSLGIAAPGGYGRYVIVPHPRYLIPFGAIPADAAATLACSGLTAYSAFKKLPQLNSGDTVLVVGAGGVGLAAVGLLRALTTARIAVADIGERQRQQAFDMGADVVFDPRGAIPEGLSCRGVLDFVGTPSSYGWLLPIVEKGGGIVVVGLYGGDMSIRLEQLPLRNIALTGSFTGSLEEMQELVSIAERGVFAFVPTQRRSFEQINAVLKQLEDGEIVGRVVATH